MTTDSAIVAMVDRSTGSYQGAWHLPLLPSLVGAEVPAIRSHLSDLGIEISRVLAVTSTGSESMIVVCQEQSGPDEIAAEAVSPRLGTSLGGQIEKLFAGSSATWINPAIERVAIEAVSRRFGPFLDYCQYRLRPLACTYRALCIDGSAVEFTLCWTAPGLPAGVARSLPVTAIDSRTFAVRIASVTGHRAETLWPADLSAWLKLWQKSVSEEGSLSDQTWMQFDGVAEACGMTRSDDWGLFLRSVVGRALRRLDHAPRGVVNASINPWALREGSASTDLSGLTLGPVGALLTSPMHLAGGVAKWRERIWEGMESSLTGPRNRGLVREELRSGLVLGTLAMASAHANASGRSRRDRKVWAELWMARLAHIA